MTAIASWLNTTFSSFDAGITLGIHRLYEIAGGILTPIMEFISLLGKGGIFLIILSLCLLFSKKTRRFGTAMAFGLAIAALLVNVWLKVVIARPRPYADVNGLYYPLWQMLGSHIESDFSFPSGHTNAAFATMIPLFVLGDKRKSWLALLFGFLMGVSRIYLVVHYPTDVIGGILTGTFGGLLGVVFSQFLPGKWYRWNLSRKRPSGRHERK